MIRIVIDIDDSNNITVNSEVIKSAAIVKPEPKVILTDKMYCKACGKEFERFGNKKFCSVKCSSEFEREYQRQYAKDHYVKAVKKEKPVQPVKHEAKPIKPTEKKKKKLTDYIGGYMAEKNTHEQAEKTLRKVKSMHSNGETIIKIPSLHNSTFHINREMTEEEIAQFRLAKIKQEKAKWDSLKR